MTLFIILGASGDLAKKKLIPAILNLNLKNFAIIGIARDKFSTKIYKPYIKNNFSKLEKKFYYYNADFTNDQTFHGMRDLIKKVEKTHKLKNRLFYLATLPEHFQLISEQLQKHNLAKNNWSRVVFEKPFGNDRHSAKKLNKCLKRVFKEDQIYRIDHYLGKELVQNISTLRFTNTILEPLWNKKYIDHVQIAINEKIGVEKRGGFYDHYGALKDVIQNHSLQLLSLIGMESPKKLTEKNIRDQKVRLLKKVSVKEVALGQYKGYTKELKVKKDSKTETLAALKLNIRNRRWRNVPFYLITGKHMEEKLASIHIEFKKAPCLFDICNFNSNFLNIQIQPEEGFYLQVNSKAPNSAETVPVRMDFCHSCEFGPNTPEAYETLLLDVIKGDQSAFIRSDEIETAWKIVDKIKKPKPQAYKKGDLPKKVNQLIKKDSRNWHLKVTKLTK